MTFKTETGSVYTLDKGTMGWSRVATSESGKIRKEFGTLLVWPEVEVGKTAYLCDSTIAPHCSHHYVFTSPVVSKED